ncbi:MAG: CvpA family protein [Eubacteriales bacterium]|nr:CvpA family protein [Eubacteriales bacterium]
MNMIDLAFLGLILLTMAIGYYRGFLISALDLGCGIVSSLLGWAFYLPAARALNAGDKLVTMLMGFSESADIIGSVETFATPVSALGQGQAAALVQGLSLPASLSRAYQANLETARYAGKGISTVGDYLSRTIGEHAVNVLGFVMVFLICFIVLLVAVRLADHTISLPALKVADGITGAVMGFLTASLVIFVLCTAFPVAEAFLPFDELHRLIDGSQFSQLFYAGNPFLRLIRGFL